MAIRKWTNKRMAVVLVHWLVFQGIIPPSLTFYIHFKEKGALTPNDPFVFVGENLTLTCTLTNRNLAGDSLGMVFSSGERALDSGYSRQTGQWAVELNYPVALSNDKSLVVCWLHNTTGVLIDSQIITVDYPAAKVRNVSCVVDNWRNLTCTWDLPYPYKYTDNLIVEIQLSRSWSSNRTFTALERSLVHAKWASDGKSGFVFGYNYSLKINLTYQTKRPRGSFSKARIRRIRTRTLVKPSPIFRWKVTRRNASAVWVEVFHSNNAHDKKLYVRYASQWNPNIWCQKEMDWRKRERMGFELSPLRPGTEYSVAVAVGPINPHHGFLSSWRNFTVHTMASVPLVGPEICAGCYTVLRCNETAQQCIVRLYWKSIPRPLRNGAIQGYRVEVAPPPPPPSLTTPPTTLPPPLEKGATARRGGCVPVDDYPYPQEPSRVCQRSGKGWLGGGGGGGGDEVVVGDTSTSSLLTLKASEGARLVRLYAVASSQNRTSPACSFLLLPSLSERPAPVEMLVVEVNDHQAHEEWDGHFFLRWTGRGSHTLFYQVVWCLGNSLTRACSEGEDIQWKQVGDQHSQLHIPDTSGRHLTPDNFLVGVSRHQRRQDAQGDVSSGIVWSSCLYLRNTVPKSVAGNVGVSQGNSPGELYVTWTFDACTSDVTANVFVTDFVIYYCVTSTSDSPCVEKTKTVSGQKKWIMLKGLEGGQQYRVRVAPRSQWGQGQMSEAVIGVAPTSVEDSRNFMVLVIVVIGVVLLVVTACVVCSCCKHFRSVKGKFAENLEIDATGFATSSTDEDGILTETNHAYKLHPTRGATGTAPLPSEVTDLQEDEEEEDDNAADDPDFIQAVTQPLLKRPKQDSTSTHGSESGIELQPPQGGSDLEDAAAAAATAAAAAAAAAAATTSRAAAAARDRTGPYVPPGLQTTNQAPESPQDAESPDSQDVFPSDVASLDSSLDDDDEEEEEDEEDVSMTTLTTTHGSSAQMGAGEPRDAEETAALKASTSWDLTRPVSRAPESVAQQAFAKGSGGCVVVSAKPDSPSRPRISLSVYLEGSEICSQDDPPTPGLTLSSDCVEKGDGVSQAADLPAVKNSSGLPHNVQGPPAVSGYVPYRQRPSRAETSLTPATPTVSLHGSGADPNPSLGLDTSFESLEDQFDQLSCSSEVSVDIQDYFTRDREPVKL